MKACERYDYIIAGAGSAGCVLAARLSEDPTVRVLLIEAGPRDRHPYLKIPLAWLQIARLDRYLWRYRTEPEPGLENREIPFYRGRALGGTSSVNGMIYARGHPRDFDDWHGRNLPGWSHADVLPYFRKLEDSWRGADAHHGSHGPVGIVQSRALGDHYAELEKAAVAAGELATHDLNASPYHGISRMELTVRNGARASAATAYLAAARARPNLTVLARHSVVRVVIETHRATGVDVVGASGLRRLHADREVIVSGGTYGSPHLLMLSGIGDADALRTHGIQPVLDLPAVGKNLIDHATSHVLFGANGHDTTLSALRADRAALAALRWAWQRNGILASNGVCANIYTMTRDGLDRPDIRLICGALGPDARLWWPWREPPPPSFVCGINLLHPESRGSVSLRSSNPADTPRILFNLLTKREDCDALVRGIRRARAIYGQDPMARLIAAERAPGPALQSDDDLRAYVRRTTLMGQHPVGTCAMGPSAGEAVVDHRLKVHGIDGLRVVDASVMPDQIGGNPNIPVMMIAEKAADMIGWSTAPPSSVPRPHPFA